jgi:hypothetical protein
MDLQLPVQSVPITTKVVRSIPAQGEVYYVMKFVRSWFSSGIPISSINKTGMLLKVALFYAKHILIIWCMSQTSFT